MIMGDPSWTNASQVAWSGPHIMGNSYSAKPALPSSSFSKVKQAPESSDDVYLGNSIAQRTVQQLPASRHPGAARKVSLTQQGQSLVHDLPTSSMDNQPPGRLANNIVTKPQVPPINLGRHDNYISSGGLTMEQSSSARHAGVLPHVRGGAAPSARSGNHQNPSHTAAEEALRAQPYQSAETGPITPAQALRRYAEYLTPFEQSEVLDYPEVYFLGKPDVVKVKGNPHLVRTNGGYDDDRGDYNVVPKDHIAYRYEVLGILGKGSFGQVLKVLDYKTGAFKALKIIRNKKRFHHQAQVELKVLEHLRLNDPEDGHNVIHIQEHFMFRSHLCITFELLSINLYEFIKQNNFVGLSSSLIRRFAVQMLQSLAFLRHMQLIHCDLKPENVLLKNPRHSAIKVIDFGSSCFVDERVYTYIQSRFYRSPEVIMGLTYGCEIDMWSFGCILAELATGYPLFPGEDETEQLLCIMEVMGLPPSYLVEGAARQKMFFDSAGNPRIVPNSRGKTRLPGTKNLAGCLRCNDPGFVDLVARCLTWDPAQRITPEQALAHPWCREAAEQGYRSAPRYTMDQGQIYEKAPQPHSAGIKAAASIQPGAAGPAAAAGLDPTAVAWAASGVQEATAQALARQQQAAAAAAAAAAASSAAAAAASQQHQHAQQGQQQLNNVVPAAGIHSIAGGAGEGGSTAGSTPRGMDMDQPAAAGARHTAPGAAAAAAAVLGTGAVPRDQGGDGEEQAAQGLVRLQDVSYGSGKGGYVSDQVPAVAGQQPVKAKAVAVMGNSGVPVAPAGAGGALEGALGSARVVSGRGVAPAAYAGPQELAGQLQGPLYSARKASAQMDVYGSLDTNEVASDKWLQHPGVLSQPSVDGVAMQLYHRQPVGGAVRMVGGKLQAAAGQHMVAPGGVMAGPGAPGVFADASGLLALGAGGHLVHQGALRGMQQQQQQQQQVSAYSGQGHLPRGKR